MSPASPEGTADATVVLLVALPWSTVAERLSLLRLYDEGGAAERRQDEVDTALAQLFAFATPHSPSEAQLWVPWRDDNPDRHAGPSSCHTPSPTVLARLKVAVRLVSLKEELLHIIPAGPWREYCPVSFQENASPNDMPVDLPPSSFWDASLSSSASARPSPSSSSTSPPLPSFSISASSAPALFNANALPPSLQLHPEVSSSTAIEAKRTDTRKRIKPTDAPTTTLSVPAPPSVPSRCSPPYFILSLSPSLEFISIGFPTRVEECASLGK